MKIRHTIFTFFTLLALTACGGGSPSDSGGGGGGGEPEPQPPDDTEDTTPPAAPDDLSGNSGDEVIELTWDANSEEDLEGYNLYRSEQNFSSVSPMDPVNGNQLLPSTDYTDQDVQNGTTYYYRLTAVDGDNNESDLSSGVEVTPFSEPPGRPKN